MKKILTSAALGLALTVAALAPAHAQPAFEGRGMMGGGCPMMSMMGRGNRDGMGAGMMRDGGMRGGRRQGGFEMGALAEGRLAYLKAVLGITADQEAAWKDYADSVKQRVSTMQGMHETMTQTMQDGGALERMEARIAGMEAMVEALKAVKPAIEKLYGMLSDDQKESADQLVGLDCGAM